MSQEKKTRTVSLFREYFELITETLVFVFFVVTFVFQSFVVPTGSMEKTLLVGDHVFVNKFIFGPTVFDWERAILPVKEISRGDVIVFRYPENPVQDFVKRAVGMPGDSLSIRDKEVWVDGSPVRVATAWHSDPNVYSSSNTDIPDLIIRDNYDGLLIAKGHYFAMGDNRDNSLDSRYWGALNRSYIKGSPWLIWWGYEGSREQYLATGIVDKIKGIGRTMSNLISGTRWERTLKRIR